MDKNSNTLTLSYLNDDDKAYGLAGMAVSLASLDAIDKVVGVTLDTEGPMVTFSHEYYFPGSPAISPKASWDHLVENFHLSTAMVLANVMSRSYIRMHREIPEEILSSLYESIKEDGKEVCSLEDDEITAIYQKTLSYMRRIFRNPRIHPAIDEFVRVLALRRSLSGLEIRDELHMLQII